MSYYQIIQMTNGKKIKFSHAAISHLAGNAATVKEEDEIIRNWYERNAAAKLLATYARGKEDVIGISEVEYTERNVFAGERIYTVKSHKEKVMVDNRLIDVFDAMTCKVHGGTAYLWMDGSIWFVMSKDGTGTTPAAEATEIELTPTKGNVTAEPFAIPTRSATPSAEPATTQEDTAEGVELPAQKGGIEIVLGLNESDPLFGAALIKASQDNTVSPDLAGAHIVTSLAKDLPGVVVTIRIDPFGNTTITTATGRANFDAAARNAIKRVVKDGLWVVDGSGYFSRSPNRKPLTPTDGLLPINYWQASAEPVELPTQKGDAATAEFTQDDKSDKLDHQLTLGSEFVFSIDGRGGAPTTAIIAKLGDGLYRADIASDPNGNYDADAILFLGEQVATIHYHAIIVSAEAINNRQPVAERIRNSGLRGANLSSIDFSWLDLSGASIEGCNLQSAEFANAQLYGTELRECDLSYTNFSGAKLTGANLSGSNLNSAYFGYASMIEADLSKCDLPFTILKSADLTRANLSGAKLHKTNLSGTDLYRADIIGTLFCEIDPPATPPNFALADLSGSVFKECLGDMILSAAKLDGVTFFDCVVPVERLFAAESINRPLIVGMMFMNYAYITARRGVFFAIENNGDKRYFLSYTNGTYADFTNIDTGDLKDHAHIVATLDAVLGNQ